MLTHKIIMIIHLSQLIWILLFKHRFCRSSLCWLLNHKNKMSHSKIYLSHLIHSALLILTEVMSMATITFMKITWLKSQSILTYSIQTCLRSEKTAISSIRITRIIIEMFMSSLIELEWWLLLKMSGKYVKILTLMYVKKQNCNEIVSYQRSSMLN